MRAPLPAALLLICSLGVTACSSNGTGGGPAPSGSRPTAAPAPSVTSRGPSTSPVASPRTAPSRASAAPSVSEPTTTNTLPPPPRPSRPAPSTAGRLTAASLPVPAGWRTIARPGGSEEGYEGNGTWVHERDPRYAAHDVITLGCADVTRDDYADPTHALEGDYTRGSGGSGIGLVLQFASVDRARAFYNLYVRQVKACSTASSPIRTKTLPSTLGLIDQRTYTDGDWTEVGGLSGSRLTLIILGDPGHRISQATSEALLRKIVA